MQTKAAWVFKKVLWTLHQRQMLSGSRQHLLGYIYNEQRLVDLLATTESHSIVGCLFRDTIYQLGEVLKHSLPFLVLGLDSTSTLSQYRLSTTDLNCQS